jgi:predicted ATPase
VESHLHPKWQRTILPNLLNALNHEVQLQVVTTTHSPLVLASLEPFFNADEDAWFDLDLEGQDAVLRNRPYIRHGEGSLETLPKAPVKTPKRRLK